MARLIDTIEPGDRVTIVNRFGQQSTGKAMMKNRQIEAWVLNMGGKYGTPAMATDDNIVNVKKAKKKDYAAMIINGRGV